MVSNFRPHNIATLYDIFVDKDSLEGTEAGTVWDTLWVMVVVY